MSKLTSLIQSGFQSTLPLRGATATASPTACPKEISIHAPLTGSDQPAKAASLGGGNFNPRSPYGERPIWCRRCTARIFISIHAPLTGSDRPKTDSRALLAISIHAPLTGSDCHHGSRRHDFLISIHAPLTGSDNSATSLCKNIVISIHAPLTGSDATKMSNRLTLLYFIPRSPYGKRPPGYAPKMQPREISIHAPLTGSD